MELIQLICGEHRSLTVFKNHLDVIAGRLPFLSPYWWPVNDRNQWPWWLKAHFWAILHERSHESHVHFKDTGLAVASAHGGQKWDYFPVKESWKVKMVIWLSPGIYSIRLGSHILRLENIGEDTKYWQSFSDMTICQFSNFTEVEKGKNPDHQNPQKIQKVLFAQKLQILLY